MDGIQGEPAILKKNRWITRYKGLYVKKIFYFGGPLIKYTLLLVLQVILD
jgi:hypothetical protein